MLKVDYGNKAYWIAPRTYTAEPMSVSMWLKTGSPLTAGPEFSIGWSTSYMMRLYISSSKLNWACNNSGSTYYGGPLGTTTLSTNTLYHICATYNGDKSSGSGDPNGAIYINGSADTVTGAIGSGSATTSTQKFFLAGSEGSAFTYYTYNYYGHVAFWDAELTAAEALQLSKGYTPDVVRPKNLDFYAPLLRSPWIDLIGGPKA